MADRVKISVIIPTYNRASVLPRAIDSVLNQTRPADEIIIVDDGSTDATPDLMKQYEMSGIRYLKKQNGGVSSARNLGLRSASGEFVACLDSDDEWLPEMLERTLPLFEKYPSADVVFTDACWMDTQHIIEPEMNWGPRRQAFGELLGIQHGFIGCIDRRTFRLASFYLCLMLQSAVIFRASLFKKVGLYNESFRVSEDYELWLRLSRVCDVCYLDQPLVKNYIHGSNLSVSPELKELFIQNNRKALKAELAVEEDPVFRKKLERCIQNNLENQLMLRLCNGGWKKLQKALSEARADGWQSTNESMRRLKVLDHCGAGVGLLFSCLLKLAGR